MYDVVLFCDLYFHIDGSTSAQSPRNSLEEKKFFSNAMNISTVILMICIMIIVIFLIILRAI